MTAIADMLKAMSGPDDNDTFELPSGERTVLGVIRFLLNKCPGDAELLAYGTSDVSGEISSIQVRLADGQERWVNGKSRRIFQKKPT